MDSIQRLSAELYKIESSIIKWKQVIEHQNFNRSRSFITGGEPKMNDDTPSASEANLESVARNVACELTDAIVWASKSEADVPATIERLFSLIYSEWQQVDWNQYGSAFGIDPLDDPIMFDEGYDEETIS
jgi:hypothetical protein